MKINKPIAFFDLETTGVNVAQDRIVQIAVIKQHPDGTVDERERLLNPGVPIPPEATAIHGHTDADVATKPKFAQIAEGLHAFIQGCVLSGYNILHFDIPLLSEEFVRAGIQWPPADLTAIDSCTIFKKKHPRDLTSAVKVFCGEDLEGAHGALADTQAAMKVLNAQIANYEDLLGMDEKQLADYCKPDGLPRMDLAGRFLIDEEGDAIFAGGKHAGAKCVSQPGYLKWMVGDPMYTLNTKACAQQLLDLSKKK